MDHPRLHLIPQLLVHNLHLLVLYDLPNDMPRSSDLPHLDSTIYVFVEYSVHKIMCMRYVYNLLYTNKLYTITYV